MGDEPRFWDVSFADGTIVSVRPDARVMSSYVTVEQEDWFEDEMHFVRKLVTPDMVILDIGANHGVYGLTMARRLTSGHVFAFEPTKAPRAALERSRVLNGLEDRLTIIPEGLSNKSRMAFIGVSANSELNSLHGASAAHEVITLSTVNGFFARDGAPARVDFVKLDAEGEEVAILEGGSMLFDEMSPLVMFERLHGSVVNGALINAFVARGYGLYIHSPGVNILVPYDETYQDSFLLNIFACKPDRVEILRAGGFLLTASDIADAAPYDGDWRALFTAHPYAASQGAPWAEALETLPTWYREGLIAAIAGEDESASPAVRVASLTRAWTWVLGGGVGDLVTQAAMLEVFIANRLGYRGHAVKVAAEILAGKRGERFGISPFLVPGFGRVGSGGHADFDAETLVTWTTARLLDFYVARRHFSTYFVPFDQALCSQILANHYVSVGSIRRVLIWAVKSGVDMSLAEDHPLRVACQRNDAVWSEILPKAAAA